MHVSRALMRSESMDYDTHNRAEALAIALSIIYCLAVLIWNLA